MRLTLRTLLAYQDDQLTPAEAREIGAKLQEAPAARQLAERAKETIRRRRLGVPGDPTAGGDPAAPAPAGAPLDPNEVAAYLDNALPAERVTAVEQVCLADDAHLAEVAAGHQILTQALSEPIAVPPSLAARLAELAPAAVDGDGAHAPRPAHRSDRPIPAVAPLAGMTAGKSSRFEEGLPEHLRKHSRRGWGWLPYVAVALLGSIWLGSLALDADLLSGFAGNAEEADAGPSGLPPEAIAMAAAASGDADAAAAPGSPAPAADPGANPAAAEAARLAAAEAADEAEAARQAETVPVDPAPPEMADAGPGAGGEDPAPVAVASGETPSAPGEGEEAGAAEEGEPAPPAAPPAEPAPLMTVTGGRGLFALDPERGGFFAVAVGETAPTGVPLVVPEPLRATLRVEGVPVAVELLGGTRAIVAPAKSDAAAAAIKLTEGRLRLVRTGEGDASVALSAGGAAWRLAPAAGATAAAAVEPRRPRGAGADLAGSPGRAAVAAVDGAVEIVDLAPGSDGEPFALAAGRTAAMVTDAGQLAAPGAAGAAAAGLFPDGPPAWATGGPRSEADDLLAEQFVAALLPGQPLEVSLSPLIEDPREIPARQAAAALALAGRAGDLARTLKRTPHPSVALVAADGLRNMLGRGAQSDKAVNSALDREFPPESRLTLGRLLDRLTEEDARDPAIAKEIVDDLESPELAIRTLAITELERLTGVTKSYRPLDSVPQRESAVRRWRREIDRVGGLLPPKAEGAGDTPDDQQPNPPGVDLDNIVPDDL